jgi:hypothetical protein
MSTAILPFAVWASGTNQASIPANDNSLRNQILNGMVISAAVTAQPGSPAEGDIYILAATHTGVQWAGFSPKDLVIYSGGTWYAFAPIDGVVVNLNGTLIGYDAGAWTAISASGSGNVTGPGSAVDDHIATFDGTTGDLLQDGGKTIAELRVPAIQTVSSSSTVTPTFADDLVLITAQAAALALANPTGTAISGLGIVIRIKDNGTARAISYGSQYRAIGVTLPTTTVISKTLYLAMVYNSADTKWDVLAVGQEA